MFRELVNVCGSSWMGIQGAGFVSLRALGQQNETLWSPDSFRMFKVSWVFCTALV